MKLSLLLDQFEVVPSDFQYVLAELLRRDYSALCYTIIAATPYSFNPDLKDRALQPGIDFDLALCEYFPEEQERFEDLLEDAWDRLHPQGESLSSCLQGGVRYLANLSSRSVRRFLELCHGCGAHNAKRADLISRNLQRQVAESAAQAFQEALRGASEVPRGAVWRLVEEVYERGRERQEGRISIAGMVTWKEPGLSGAPALRPEEELVLKKTFQEGAFLYAAPTDARFNTLPGRWLVAPIVAAPGEGNLDYSRQTTLSRDFIARLSQTLPRRKQRIELAGLVDVKQVFLSLSFKDIAQQRVAEQQFREVFAEKHIQVVTGGSAGAAMIDDIAEKIHRSDFTLIDSTHLSANIILEMGLTYGVGHRVYPLVAETEQTELAPHHFPFLLNMGITPYSLERSKLRDARDLLLRKARISVSPPHLLMEGSTRKVKLRVKQESKTLGIYYPQSREEVWEPMIGRIQAIATRRKHKTYVVNQLPHPERLPFFENLLWSICKSKRLIIDTSGKNKVDEYGAFALGFAVGLSRLGTNKDVRRVEEKGMHHPAALSMWPENRRKEWGSADELCSLVGIVLPPGKAAEKGA